VNVLANKYRQFGLKIQPFLAKNKFNIAVQDNPRKLKTFIPPFSGAVASVASLEE
jgi:hypothetical protein